MTLLLSDDFTGSAISSSWTAGSSFFTSSCYAPNTAAQRFVTSPTPPLGGTTLHYFIPSGTDETIPVRVQKDETYTERYLEFRMFFGTGFYYPGGLKIARFGRGAGGGSTAFFEYNWNSGSPGIVFYTYNHANDVAWVGNIAYNFAENTWIKIGIHFKESSVSTSNGFFKLYINDELEIDSGLITTRTTSDTKDYVWLGGNNSWGGGTGEGGGTTASGNSSLYYANVRLYDEFPTAEPPPTPDPGPGIDETPVLPGNFSTRAMQVDFLLSGLIDPSGNPLSGGRVWSYEAGTTTKKKLYLDQAKTVIATNPVILSSRGQALVYGEGAYDFKIENSEGVLQSTINSVIYSYPDDGAVYCGLSTGSSNVYSFSPSPALVTLVDGMVLTFVANHANDGAVDVIPSNLGTYDVVRNDGVTALTTGDITSGMLVDIRWVESSNHFRLVSQSGVLGLSSGGTGAANATAARTNLGLGTLAVQNSNSVSITGGSITGTTTNAVASPDASTNIIFSIGGTTKFEVPVGTLNGASLLTPAANNYWTLATSSLALKEVHSYKFVLKDAADHPNVFAYTTRRTLDPTVATAQQCADAINTLKRDLYFAGLLAASTVWT